MTAITPSPRLRAFLDTLAFSEGTSTSKITQNQGYDIIVSGPGPDGPERFTDYSHHPFVGRPAKYVGKDRTGKDIYSTASGRYQILYSLIWVPYQRMLRLPDFSPSSQDAVAIQLITECHALPDIAAGDIDGIAAAITKCKSRWASLPGSTANQGGHSMEDLLAAYTKLEGLRPIPNLKEELRNDAEPETA